MSRPLSDKQKHIIREKYKQRSADQLAKELKGDPSKIQEYIDQLKPALTPSKRKVFTVLTIVFPIFLLFLFEIGLRVFGYGGDLRLFVPATDPGVEDYYRINHDVGKRYFYMQNTVPRPTKDLFLKQKPENGYRIFVLGGSTTAGFPYGNNVTFSRILNKRLDRVFPHKRIEVINVAMAAICSYTLVDFMDEILAMKPDALLIYAGHNEFYGAMGVGSMESLGKNPSLVHGYLKLRNLRLYLLMRDVIGQLRKTSSQLMHGATEVDPTATLMARIVDDKVIPLDSQLYRKGLNQFKSNLTRIMDRASEAGVPVILSELVSNVRDQRPFVSLKTENHPAADAVYEKASSLEERRNYDEAKSAYERAKDLDALRFRATEEWNGIIHRFGETYQSAVVPMKNAFEQKSSHALIGDPLMVDHLHPNIDGYFIMADAFFQTMHDYRFVDPDWDDGQIVSSESLKKSWAISALDSVYAALSIRYLKGGWPFKSENRPNRALDDFKPQTTVDSLAVQALVNPDISLTQANLRLAEIYEHKGMNLQALKVYRALYHAIPHEILFYHRAANLLIKQKQYKQAYDVLAMSNRISQNYHATKWMGQIHLIQNELLEGIQLLEIAIRLERPDAQILYNLGRSYVQTLQFKKAQRIIDLITSLYPGSSYVQQLNQQIQQMLPVLEEVHTLNQKAWERIRNKDYNTAEHILRESLQVHESKAANLFMTQIYISLKEYDAALRMIQKVLAYDPNETEMLYKAAGLSLETGRTDLAREFMMRIREIDPDFSDRMNLEDKLDS